MSKFMFLFGFYAYLFFLSLFKWQISKRIKVEGWQLCEEFDFESSIPRFAQTFTLKKYFTKITGLSKFRNI